MKVKILGSGGWAGIPAAFCHCRVCTQAARFPQGKDNRNRPELLVTTSTDHFLIEIGPDIRLQSVRFNLPNIKYFLVSHNHFDHMGGLTQLNSWIRYHLKDIPVIYCSQKTKDWLKVEDWDIQKDIHVIKPYENFDVVGTSVTAIPLFHVKKEDEKVAAHKLENEYGFILHSGKKKIVYLGDYYKIPEKAFKLIKGAEYVIMDATYLFQEKYPRNAEQIGLWKDPDHLHGKKIIELGKQFEAKQIILTNITHLSRLLHSELETLIPSGFKIAYDGMELDLT